MAEKMLKTRIQNKHEPEANWLQATNFIPLAGELIVYDADETHSKPRFKIGDGVRNPDTGKIEGTNVNDLPFVTDDFITNDELDTKLNNEYQEKFATVTKDGELTTGIQFTTDIYETLTDTARVELQKGGIELAAYGSISLDTNNGPISINSDQDIVLNSLYGGVDASNKRIKNVATPTEDTDAVNKQYVNDIIAYAMNETQADYVVEQGASGIWTYRKWASGKAECWGRKHITASMSQVTDNTFYYLSTSFWETDYPFEFADVPCEVVSYHAPSSHMGWAYSQWENTQSRSGRYCAMRWNSETSEADVYLDYYVIGMWR